MPRQTNLALTHLIGSLGELRLSPVQAMFCLVTLRCNGCLFSFRSKLKEHMKYVTEHPEEMSKFAKIKAQVAEVKGVMKDNIDKVCAWLARIS